jgi:hypothetical protein
MNASNIIGKVVANVVTNQVELSVGGGKVEVVEAIIFTDGRQVSAYHVDLGPFVNDCFLSISDAPTEVDIDVIELLDNVSAALETCLAHTHPGWRAKFAEDYDNKERWCKQARELCAKWLRPEDQGAKT